jgi:hypothetical protein
VLYLGRAHVAVDQHHVYVTGVGTGERFVQFTGGAYYASAHFCDRCLLPAYTGIVRPVFWRP